MFTSDLAKKEPLHSAFLGLSPFQDAFTNFFLMTGRWSIGRSEEELRIRPLLVFCVCISIVFWSIQEVFEYFYFFFCAYTSNKNVGWLTPTFYFFKPRHYEKLLQFQVFPKARRKKFFFFSNYVSFFYISFYFFFVRTHSIHKCHFIKITSFFFPLFYSFIQYTLHIPNQAGKSFV